MKKISALVVYHDTETFRSLEPALARLALTVRTAGSYAEACAALGKTETPHVIFTDTLLPDGNWADVVARAAQAPEPTNVIVVTRVVDLQLYAEVLEAGAFDYIVPPFYGLGFEHVVHGAVNHILEQRETAQRRENGEPQNDLFHPLALRRSRESTGFRSR